MWRMMPKDLKKILYSICYTLAAVLIAAVPFYFLWNDTLPILFHLPKITFRQSVELLFIVVIPKITT